MCKKSSKFAANLIFMKWIKWILMMSLVSFVQGACSAPQTPNEPMRSFSYSYIGTIGGGSFTWTIRREDDGTVRFVLRNPHQEDYDNLSDTVSVSLMDEIEALCRKYEAHQWDGYDETARGVCDGSGFSMDIRYQDGQRVSVYGMNSAPKSFWNFEKELYRICTPYRDRLMEIGRQRMIEKGVQGPLRSILASFNLRSEGEKYYVLIRREDLTENNVEVRINDQSFYGHIPDAQIKWEDFEKLIKKHHLVQWMDFKGTAEKPNESEWFQIAFSFEQGRICAHGSAYPEGYEAFRKDFIQLLNTKCKKWGILQ